MPYVSDVKLAKEKLPITVLLKLDDASFERRNKPFVTINIKFISNKTRLNNLIPPGVFNSTTSGALLA